MNDTVLIGVLDDAIEFLGKVRARLIETDTTGNVWDRAQSEDVKSQRMISILSAFDGTSPWDGKNRAEASAIATEAGIDPGAIPGYFSSGYLERQGDIRYITEKGKNKLAELLDRFGDVVLPRPGELAE